MVIVKIREGLSFYMDKDLKDNLDISIYKLRNCDMDVVIVLDGPEGAGKSKLARQVAAYCSKELGTTFGIDNIHFQLDNYLRASLKNGKGTINLLDESRAILNRKRSTANSGVRFTNYLSECRSKGQVHILLLPSYHDLDSYVVLWRMSFLIHLKTRMVQSDNSVGWEFMRGEYVLYPTLQLRDYFLNWKMRYKYPHYEKTDLGTFKNIEVLEDIAKYNAKKDAATIQKYVITEEEEEATITTKKDWRNKSIMEAHQEGLDSKTIAKTFKVSTRTITRILREGKTKDTKLVS